jgi:hypothetical protein
MRHLLSRHRLAGVSEQVILVDGAEAYLPGSAELLASLGHAGFSIRHITAEQLPAGAGVHGVPYLAIAAPDGKLAYLGGYGEAGDQDVEIVREVQAGSTPKARAVLGCAVGREVRSGADPFHLKYPSAAGHAVRPERGTE